MSREPRSPPRRKLSPASVRSPGAIFLYFAARNLDESCRLEGAGRDVERRWRAVEHRLSAFVFACSALEAHVVGVHQCFFAHRLPAREVRAWRELPLDERVKDLLPKRSLSSRRRRLLAEVMAFKRRVEQPPPFQVAEQIELFGPPEPPSSGTFWFGAERGAFVKVTPKRDDDNEDRPTGLPKDPLDLEAVPLVTALLVVLEHCVLLDRHFQGWAEWPLSLRRDGRTVTAAEWFFELRAGYDGPHAAYFRRIRTDLEEAGEE